MSLWISNIHIFTMVSFIFSQHFHFFGSKIQHFSTFCSNQDDHVCCKVWSWHTCKRNIFAGEVENILSPHHYAFFSAGKHPHRHNAGVIFFSAFCSKKFFFWGDFLKMTCTLRCTIINMVHRKVNTWNMKNSFLDTP